MTTEQDEVRERWNEVRDALEKARQWDIAFAKGGQVPVTRPEPMRAIRYLVRAAERKAYDRGFDACAAIDDNEPGPNPRPPRNITIEPVL